MLFRIKSGGKTTEILTLLYVIKLKYKTEIGLLNSSAHRWQRVRPYVNCPKQRNDGALWIFKKVFTCRLGEMQMLQFPYLTSYIEISLHVSIFSILPHPPPPTLTINRSAKHESLNFIQYKIKRRNRDNTSEKAN